MSFPTIHPVRRRVGRSYAKGESTPVPPPAVLTLVSAVYDPGGTVSLTFDRAIDISGMDVSAVSVDDGAVMNFKYRGWGDSPPELTGPDTVLVYLNGYEDGGDPGVHLTVDAGNGIVPAGGGAAFGGVSDVSLPMP